jgi:hypothetical protein
MFQYLTIERKDNNGKNAIYYKKEKIADSLQSFIKDYDGNRDGLQYDIKHIDAAEIKKGIPQATLRNTFVCRKETENKKEVENKPVDKQPKPVVLPDQPVSNSAKEHNRHSWILDDDDNIIIS